MRPYVLEVCRSHAAKLRAFFPDGVAPQPLAASKVKPGDDDEDDEDESQDGLEKALQKCEDGGSDSDGPMRMVGADGDEWDEDPEDAAERKADEKKDKKYMKEAMKQAAKGAGDPAADEEEDSSDDDSEESESDDEADDGPAGFTAFLEAASLVVRTRGFHSLTSLLNLSHVCL